MDILSQIKILPNEIQNKIFYYLYNEESNIIKKLEWNKEYQIQKHKSIKRNKKLIDTYPLYRHYYENIYGYEYSELKGYIYFHNTDKNSWNYYCDDISNYFTTERVICNLSRYLVII
jgi:hypothetical protein